MDRGRSANSTQPGPRWGRRPDLKCKNPDLRLAPYFFANALPRRLDIQVFAVSTATAAWRLSRFALPFRHAGGEKCCAKTRDDGRVCIWLCLEKVLESNTLAPLLKKLDAMGYVRRRRDAADERQMVVSLTDAGHRLREKGSGMNLMKASGLSAGEFPKMQRSVVALRDNLIKVTQDE